MESMDRWNAMQWSAMEWSRWNAMQWSGMEWMHFEHFGSCCKLLVIFGNLLDKDTPFQTVVPSGRICWSFVWPKKRHFKMFIFYVFLTKNYQTIRPEGLTFCHGVFLSNKWPTVSKTTNNYQNDSKCIHSILLHCNAFHRLHSIALRCIAFHRSIDSISLHERMVERMVRLRAFGDIENHRGNQLSVLGNALLKTLRAAHAGCIGMSFVTISANFC